MPIYCDESGGVGRGVMTMGAIFIDEDEAEALLQRYRDVTGLKGELKGSRIDLAERALVIELLEKTDMKAVVSIAISATDNSDTRKGQHDVAVYASLMNDAVGALLSKIPACRNVVMDGGRYSEDVLELIRRDIADIIGPWNTSRLEESDKLAGLQLADILANSFFNRARVSGKQVRIAAMLRPMIDAGRIEMRVLDGEDVDPFPIKFADSK